MPILRAPASPFSLSITFACIACLPLLASRGRAEEHDWLERFAEALTFDSTDGVARARISGSIEADAYYTPTPRGDLRFHDDDTLLAPRLRVFLDSQYGERTYGFAQARVDSGFDPSDGPAELRLDELALRLRLDGRGRATLQAGKFASVVGAWSKRHLAWQNPFVTAPLPFEGLTPMWDRRATVSIPQVLRRAHVVPLSGGAGVGTDKHQRLPIIWGPAYTTGAALAGTFGRMDYAFELKNAMPGSRPESWGFDERPWGPPAWGGRVGYRPNVMWDAGVSAAGGTYLNRDAIPTVPPGTRAADHRQNLIGVDLSFAHRHLQLWAEAYASRYTAPGVEDLDTIAYYLEAKYRFAPRIAGAVRWNHQLYSNVDDPAGGRTRWGRETVRLDLVLIGRLTHAMELKVQYSPQWEYPAPDTTSHAVAMQFVARF